MRDEGEFFELLTDALRNGPGGPSWPRAVEQLRALNGSGHELRLLMEVRERLDAARSYGEIQPTPEFTQRVLASLAAEAAAEPIAGLDAPINRRWDQPLGPKTLAGLALAAAVMIVLMAGLVLKAVLGDGASRTVFLPMTPETPAGGVETFQSVLPADWQPVGTLRVKAERGLRLAGGAKVVDQYGGLVRSEALTADEPLRLQATVHLLDGAGVAPELFITDDTDFSVDRPAAQRHELVWTFSGNRPQVRLPNQTVEMAGEPLAAGGRMLSVEIKLNEHGVAVETTAGGHKLGCWTGSNSLALDKPWHAGIRFVVHGQNHDDCVEVQSFKISHH